MKIEISQSKLIKAIHRAEKLAQKHQTLPVLSCIFCVTEKNKFILRATNLEVGIEITIPAKIENEGMVAIPAQVFSACIGGIREEKIILEVSDGNVHISSLQGDFKLKAQPYEDFPSIPLVSEETIFTLQSKDLVQGIKSVWYASSVSTMKPELSSVYIYSQNDYVYFVATDSFRLAEKKIPLKKKVELPSLLIPFKNASEIMRVFEDVNDEIECHVGKNQISFITEDIHFTSRAVDGVFPDYRMILPKESTTEAVFIKDDLTQGLKLATIFTDKFNQVRFHVIPTKKTVEIMSKNSDTGEGKRLLKATISGDEVTISFNHRYITDSFQSLSGESVSLSFNGPQRPVLIKSVSDSSFTYIVMPMNR